MLWAKARPGGSHWSGLLRRGNTLRLAEYHAIRERLPGSTGRSAVQLQPCAAARPAGVTTADTLALEGVELPCTTERNGEATASVTLGGDRAAWQVIEWQAAGDGIA